MQNAAANLLLKDKSGFKLMEALNHPQFTGLSWVDDFLIKTIKIIIISSF
jgi:hypothetical protein